MVIKLFSCSTQVRLLKIVGILTFMSRINFSLSRVELEKCYNLDGKSMVCTD